MLRFMHLVHGLSYNRTGGLSKKSAPRVEPRPKFPGEAEQKRDLTYEIAGHVLEAHGYEN